MSKYLVTGGSGFIGIHLVELLLKEGHNVLNLDINPPINQQNLQCWRNVDVRESKHLAENIQNFRPDFVVYLAGETKQGDHMIEEFSANFLGVYNTIESIKTLSPVPRLIYASTQYVNLPGKHLPHNMDDFIPYGTYGTSKLMGEKILIKEGDVFEWIIVRPATIWGPWHPILSKGLYKHLSRRTYFHPKKDIVIKAYGFVENTCFQLYKLTTVKMSELRSRTVYLADDNLSQATWVNELSKAFSGKKVKYLPKGLIYILSEIGELAQKYLGINVPIFRSRFQNLITSNKLELENTVILLGEPVVSLDEACLKTARWFLDS